MEIIILPDALTHLQYWKKTGNQIILKRIALLLKAIEIDPFNGIGKPEKLKHNLTGTWSRRIDKEHRLIYEIKDNAILIHSLQGHY